MTGGTDVQDLAGTDSERVAAVTDGRVDRQASEFVAQPLGTAR